MRRLKKGDICPLCGEPINTSDPFTLGYLSAWADLTASPGGSADEGGDDSFPFAYAEECAASGRIFRTAGKEDGHEYKYCRLG